MSKQRAIICDLDGTLYDARKRQADHLMGDKKDFDAFHKAAKDDPPHEWCLQILQAMKAFGFVTIFTSGRDDSEESDTHWWIKRHLNWGNHEYELHMRPKGDYTPDDVMKQKWLEERINPIFDILFAIDDRKRVADMWRRMGITCLHCAEGNF